MYCEQRNLKITDYDYLLKDDQIALYPCQNREDSQLLIYNKGNISVNSFANIANYIPQNSLLLFNDTKVVQARILFEKNGGSTIEVFFLEVISPSDPSEAFACTTHVEALCFVGNNKRWKQGLLSKTLTINTKKEKCSLYVERLEARKDAWLLRFSWDNKNFCFADILEAAGEIPLPPYIQRKTEVSDIERYQSVFAKYKGSVAAPTASLHFTPDIAKHLEHKGILFDFLTLHVGAGTFKPIKSELVGDHNMHSEMVIIRKECLINLRKNCKQSFIAVGTTSCRSLESLYWLALKLMNKNSNSLEINQWDPYEQFQNMNVSCEETLDFLLQYMEEQNLENLLYKTSLLIAPGYNFKFCKGLITNFHQPKSTLLLLVAALIGPSWKDVYNFAITEKFRFLSYGDGSILLP